MQSIQVQVRIICVLLVCLLFTLTARAQNTAAKPYFDRGYDQYERGQYEDAIRNFTLALDADPNAYLAYYNRGLAQSKLGNYDAAIADYTRTLLINHEYTYAVYARALAKYKKGDYDGAIADSNDAIHLNSSYADAYYNRGNAHYGKENFSQAAADYAETIRLNPSYANGYWGRGSARNKMGDAQGALNDYEKAVQLDPSLQSQLGPTINDLRAQLATPATPASNSRTQEVEFGTPRVYDHKSGWFSMSIPENWKVTDKSSADEVIVSLADPTENAIVVVRVYSPNRGSTQSELGESLRAFVNDRMSSFDGFSAGDLRSQKDGSIGLSFKYNQPLEGKNYQMYGDAFIEQHNGLVGILALVMPQDQYDTKKKDAYDLLNSFRVTGVGK
jgi:tetratricopeptide (TPR) repeat protein